MPRIDYLLANWSKLKNFVINGLITQFCIMINIHMFRLDVISENCYFDIFLEGFLMKNYLWPRWTKLVSLFSTISKIVRKDSLVFQKIRKTVTITAYLGMLLWEDSNIRPFDFVYIWVVIQSQLFVKSGNEKLTVSLWWSWSSPEP